MRITAIEAVPLAAPYERAFGVGRVPPHLSHPAANQMAAPRLGQFSTLIRVRTDEELEGIGEAFGLPDSRITATVASVYLTKLLIGRNPLDTTVIWESMYAAQRGAGHSRGFMLDAIAGIDIALWDLKGKYFDQPIYRLLGGACRDAVPVYGSPVPLMETPEEAAREAAALVARGFSRVKVKVGRGIERDLADVNAVREALGQDVTVMVDANGAYDTRTAIMLSRELQPLGVSWLEEPVPPEDLDGLSEVHRRSEIPVVTGECESTAFGVLEILRRAAADAVQPNIARAGGFTECVRISDLARLFNIRVAPHGVGSSLAIVAALHWCMAMPNLWVYEYNQLLNPLRERLLNEALELREGCLMPPAGPGLGVSLDEASVAEFAVL